MNQDQFAYWLQGFVEMNGGKEPTKAQWKMIKDHLQLCFVKVPYGVGGTYGGDLKLVGNGSVGKFYSACGAGVPMNKYGRALTNAEIALMQGEGGGR
jgi:hypothetical protein